MRLHYYYAVSICCIALAISSAINTKVFTPYDAAFEYLASINEFTKTKIAIVKSNYDDCLNQLTRLSRRTSYFAIRKQMKTRIDLIVNEISLIERNSVIIRLAYSMCCHMYWTIWKWYYLNWSPEKDTPQNDLAEYINSLFDRLTDIREYKLNNKVRPADLAGGLLMCSEEIMNVVSNVSPIAIGRTINALQKIIQLQRLVLFESSFNLYSVFKRSLVGFERAGKVQTSIGPDPVPFTTDNWDCYQLGRAHEMSVEGMEGLKGLVSIFNHHGNSKYYQPIRFQIPKSSHSVLGVFMSEGSFALPAPVLKIIDLYPLEHDPNMMIRLLWHLNDI